MLLTWKFCILCHYILKILLRAGALLEANASMLPHIIRLLQRTVHDEHSLLVETPTLCYRNFILLFGQLILLQLAGRKYFTVCWSWCLRLIWGQFAVLLETNSLNLRDFKIHQFNQFKLSSTFFNLISKGFCFLEEMIVLIYIQLIIMNKKS